MTGRLIVCDTSNNGASEIPELWRDSKTLVISKRQSDPITKRI
jgi:hypothetical protein